MLGWAGTTTSDPITAALNIRALAVSYKLCSIKASFYLRVSIGKCVLLAYRISA
jgi:hypothetical protein